MGSVASVSVGIEVAVGGALVGLGVAVGGVIGVSVGIGVAAGRKVAVGASVLAGGGALVVSGMALGASLPPQAVSRNTINKAQSKRLISLVIFILSLRLCLDRVLFPF